MRHSSPSVLLLVVVTSVGGCAGDKASSSAGSACANYANALLEEKERCSSSNFSVSSVRRNELFARFETQCLSRLAAPGNGLTASALDACAATLVNSCGDSAACTALERVTGTLAAGAPCGANTQCQSQYCKVDGASTCGVCAAVVSLGGACGDNAGDTRCGPGGTCQSKGGTGTCVADAKLGEGAVCYDPRASSGEVGRCDAGLICDLLAGSPPATCKKRVLEGGGCATTSQCAVSLACVHGTCGARQGEGAPCTQNDECASGLACETTSNTCARIVFGKAGDTCGTGLKRCERGSCRALDGRTVEPGTTGSEHPTSGTCIDPIGDGARCTANGPRCDTYASCTAGTCQVSNPSLCK